MGQNRSDFSKLQLLAAQWRVFGMMLVALAREVCRLETTRNRHAPARAQQLQAACLTAAVTLTRELDSLPPDTARSADDESAYAHLRVIAGMLTLLTLFAAQLKHRLFKQAQNPANYKSLPAPHCAAPLCAPRRVPGYLDSS